MSKILIIFLIIFLVLRLAGNFFRVFLGTSTSQRDGFSGNANTKSRPADGNVNIDFVPKKDQKKSSKNYRGGEYVDYEELD
ncbi:MAG: DUF4834 domain-containing protein [Bacteroidota bacterium]